MPKKSPTARNENNQKGRLLEEVVAMLYEYEGYKVEKNAELPPISGNSKRKRREIDVLLTKYVFGEPTYTVIQCKNEKGKIGIERIDEFIGFLHDIGVSSQKGILICVNGLTKDALMKADEVGIETFTFKGLTADRLAKAVERAFQYVVYLVPEVTQITLENKIPLKDAQNAVAFVYKNKDYAGDLLSLIINHWRQGKISNDLTEYEFNLKIPQGWYQIVNNKPKRTDFILIKVRIIAHVIEIAGKLEEFSIVDAKSKATKKYRLNVNFETPIKERKRFSVVKVFSEAQLKEVINSESKIRIINKIRLPRIFYNNLYHPPSKRVWSIIESKTKGLSNKQIQNFSSVINFEEIEGSNLISSAYEEPFFPFPVLSEDDQENIIDIRLLMKNRMYTEVLSFKSQFDKHPTPEFAELLAIARKEIGKQILGLK